MKRVPSSPLKQCGGSLKNKAELVTLAISNDNILQVSHDRASTAGHQAQSPVIVGLCELVLICKPETSSASRSLLKRYQPRDD